MGTFLLPLPKWRNELDEYSSGCCGFFSRLSQGENLKEAFLSVKENLTFPSDIKAELDALFSDFGRGYVKEELSKLDGAISALAAYDVRLREDVKNDSRSVKALIIAAALGLVILLI